MMKNKPEIIRNVRNGVVVATVAAAGSLLAANLTGVLNKPWLPFHRSSGVADLGDNAEMKYHVYGVFNSARDSVEKNSIQPAIVDIRNSFPEVGQFATVTVEVDSERTGLISTSCSDVTRELTLVSDLRSQIVDETIWLLNEECGDVNTDVVTSLEAEEKIDPISKRSLFLIMATIMVVASAVSFSIGSGRMDEQTSKQVKSLRSALDKLRDEYDDLKGDHDALLKKYDDHKKVWIDDKENLIKRHKKELQGLRDKHAQELQAARDKKSQDLDSARQRVAVLETEIKGLEDQIEELKRVSFEKMAQAADGTVITKMMEDANAAIEFGERMRRSAMSLMSQKNADSESDRFILFSYNPDLGPIVASAELLLDDIVVRFCGTDNPDAESNALLVEPLLKALKDVKNHIVAQELKEACFKVRELFGEIRMLMKIAGLSATADPGADVDPGVAWAEYVVQNRIISEWLDENGQLLDFFLELKIDRIYDWSEEFSRLAYKAYRSRSRETHPDLVTGGSDDAFKRVATANKVFKDKDDFDLYVGALKFYESLYLNSNNNEQTENRSEAAA